MEACREAFNAFDTNESGEIDAWELRDILKGLGRNPTDEELFELISIVDTNMSGTIDFAEFLQVIDYQKSNAAKGKTSMQVATVRAPGARGGCFLMFLFLECGRAP